MFAIASGGQTLAGNVAYKPFRPAESMDLGPLALTRTYDQRYQLTGIQAGTVLNYGYTHDGAGNVETISGLPKPDFFPRLADLTYNANRMATQNTDWIGAGVVLPSPAAVYSYDNVGNIVSDGLHTDYFYNQNNRLVRVEIDGLTVAEYAYDAFERRVMKVVNGVTTHFHYDLNGLLISETDGNGNPRKDYVYLNGEPVAMKVYGGSAGWHWFITDHVGTPQKMVDESGAVVWAAAYAPFGEARVYKDEVTNNLRFPGQYYDVETGLHYNWHRYYDPGAGRYLRPDPIGLKGGMNVYAYTYNSPVNASDISGLLTEVIITGGNWHGHSAINLNGTVYSNGRYNPESANSFGMKGDNILVVQDHEVYVNFYMNKKVDSTGYILSISPSQEQKIQGYFNEMISGSAKWKFGYKIPKDYSFMSENCTTTVTEGLQEGLSWFNDLWIESISPYQLEFHLKTAPWLVESVVQYPGKKNP